MPEFYMIFAGKNARILHNNCPENIFFQIFFLGGGGGHVPPLPPSPTPMITNELWLLMNYDY